MDPDTKRVEATEVLTDLHDTGWSDAAISLAIGASRRTVWSWRTGRTIPISAVTKTLYGLYSLNKLALAMESSDDPDGGRRWRFTELASGQKGQRAKGSNGRDPNKAYS